MGLSNFSNAPTPPQNGNGGNSNNNGSTGGGSNGINSMFQMSGSNVDVDDLLINYNEKFKSSGTILFRDAVVQQTIGTLIGKNKPNTILVGPAGVGKTKIVEDIAFRLANDDDLIPSKLKGAVIYELPLSNIVSGSSYVGQVEEKIKAVIDKMTDPKEHAILFIDEIHQLVDSHDSTYKKIAQILKPALARGDMRVIGATTTQEMKDLSEDPAFNRRFTKLVVDELSIEQTEEILFHAKSGFFAHYNNKIQLNDDTLKTIVLLADEYRPAGSHRPDNALTLLDRSIGDTIVNHAVRLKAARATGDKNIIASVMAINPIPVTERQIKATAIRLATGNSKPEEVHFDELQDALSCIKGQDEVVEKLVRVLREHECPLYHCDATTGGKSKPETLLFVGPSGVGKTEITKIMSQYVSGTKPIILNMTEYNSPASINRIIGSPAGFVGSDSHTELPFDILASNPYQVILLDEFEKCDKSVQTLFMQAFDEGYITTSKGDIVDFSKAIIIATTNAGYTEHMKPLGFRNTNTSNRIDISTLSKWFDIALLNRFTHQIAFNEIGADIYREILVNAYARDVERILKIHPRTQLLPEIPEKDLDRLVKDTYVPDFGARPVNATIKQYVLNQVL